MNEQNNNNLSYKKPNFIKLFFSKFKKIKHLDIILTVLFIAIILLIYFSTFSSTKIEKNSNENSNTSYSNESGEDLLLNYTKEVENKLVKVISQLKGVGNVTVAVKLKGNIENIYAYTTKEEVLENGTRVETKTPILLDDAGKSSPLVLQTIMPDVETIVVISSGAKDTNVKLDILRVIQLLYNLPNSKIDIFVGN